MTSYLPLDAVGGPLEDGHLAWSLEGDDPDLFVLRINYLTPPSRLILDESFTVGGPDSHMLWEIYVPGDQREVTLPPIPDDAPGWPLLANPLPSTDWTDVNHHYDEDTLELEINVYQLGAEKTYEYNRDFLLTDLNLEAIGVSQDSYLFRAPQD